MPDDSRLTRRTLLKKAGAGAAVVLGSGIALERLLGGKDPSREYLTGFNDDFVVYGETAFAEATMRRVRDRRGLLLRFPVDWGRVQAAGPRSFDWSAYDRLYGLALRSGLQLLPWIHGCPPWAGPVRTAARWPGNEPEIPSPSFRTCSPRHDRDFGNFAAGTLRHFDTFSRQGRATVIRAVEILNEPNLWTFGDVPAKRVRELANAAAESVSASQADGAYSRPMRVISGGVGPVGSIQAGNRLVLPPRIAWQDYLRELLTGPVGFEPGIHSYESAKPPPGVLTAPEENPEDPFARGREYAHWQAAAILKRVDQALDLAPDGIWLTETGASSGALWPVDVFSPGYRARFGQQIQAEALTAIATGLESRPRCRSMIVHRLYSNDQAEPPPEAGRNSPHFQSGVYDGVNGRPKLAAGALTEAWA